MTLECFHAEVKLAESGIDPLDSLAGNLATVCTQHTPI